MQHHKIGQRIQHSDCFFSQNPVHGNSNVTNFSVISKGRNVQIHSISPIRRLHWLLMESINIVRWARRGSSVAQGYPNCDAICTACFVNLPRRAFSFFNQEKVLIEKQHRQNSRRTPPYFLRFMRKDRCPSTGERSGTGTVRS